MTEVITEYDATVEASDATTWSARACARPKGARWEGWLEFVPLTGAVDPVRTPVETTQGDRDAMLHWAQALRPTYLEGALERARNRPVGVASEPIRPLFDTPAPVVRTTNVPADPASDVVLDPYAVYAQGEEILVARLAALDSMHLRRIVNAHGMTAPETAAGASHAELIRHILAAVRTQA